MLFEKRLRTLVALFAVFWLYSGSMALGSQVTIAWDAKPPGEQVTGYFVHYGAKSRTDAGFVDYDNKVDVGNVMGADTLVT